MDCMCVCVYMCAIRCRSFRATDAKLGTRYDVHREKVFVISYSLPDALPVLRPCDILAPANVKILSPKDISFSLQAVRRQLINRGCRENEEECYRPG